MRYLVLLPDQENDVLPAPAHHVVVPLGLELLRGHEVPRGATWPGPRDLAAGQAPVPQVVLLLGREPLPACPARLSMCCSYIILHLLILLGTTMGPCCWPGSCTPSGAPTWPRTTCPAPHAVRVLVLGRDQMVVVLGRGHEVPRGRGHGTLLLARLLYHKWCSYLAENRCLLVLPGSPLP